MMQPAARSFERHAAELLLGQRAELTRSWVARLATEAQVRPRRALPADRLLELFPGVLQYVAGRRVRIGFGHQEENGVWLVCVSDNGLGIPPEHHDRIFQRFFRAHPAHSEGTGLGLAIVLEAVQQLGGRIEFQSEQGTGSTFRVSLPSRQTEDESL